MKKNSNQADIRFLPPPPPKPPGDKPPDLVHPDRNVNWGTPLKVYAGNLRGEFSSTSRVQQTLMNEIFLQFETSVPVVGIVLFCAECRVSDPGAQLTVGISPDNYTVVGYPLGVATTQVNYELRSFTQGVSFNAGNCTLRMSMSVDRGTGYVRNPNMTVWLVSI
jgi:hypothetical protein